MTGAWQRRDWRLRAFVCRIVCCGAVLSPIAAQASAEAIHTDTQEDLETLKSELTAHSDYLTSGTRWSEAGATVDKAAERALAGIKVAQEKYDGTTLNVSSVWPGANAAAINAEASAMEEGLSTASKEGSVEAHIGGQLLDIVGAEALAPGLGGVLYLGGKLGYEDITTGTNEVTVALYSALEDHSDFALDASESLESDVAAEQLAWTGYKLPEGCGSELAYCAEEQEDAEAHCPGHPPPWVWSEHVCSESEAISRFGDSLANHDVFGYSLESKIPVAEHKREFFLEAKVGGIWYLGSNAGKFGTYPGPGLTSTSAQLHGWMTPEKLGSLASYGRYSCDEEGYLFHKGIAGLPSELGPYIDSGPGIEERRCEPAFTTGGAVTVRAPSRMHIGLAKSMTKAEVEALEAAGYPVEHQTGHPLGIEGGPTTLAAIEGALKARTEGGARTLEEAEKHWFETVEGGSAETPLPGTAEIPTCSGTGTECKSALEGAGFTDVKVVTLSLSAATASKGNNAVTSTSPAAKAVVEISAEVTVTQNPPEAHEIIALAEAFTTKNPGTSLTGPELEEVAARCLERTKAASLSEPKVECENWPIFLTGSDVPTATNHDIDALGEPGHAQWVRLTYESETEAKERMEAEGGGEKVQRNWYKGKPDCKEPKPEGETCDEFPFFSSGQSGPYVSPKPSLRWINETDNGLQGGKYGNFVSSWCKLSAGATFLVVPLEPSLGIATTRLCN